jgi:hypothetical protein
MNKWTREQIVREILRREAEALPLTSGSDQGVESSLYQAAARIFGSWRNAVMAAGVSPQKACAHDQWAPARIISIIRDLSRRRRPLSREELKQRYGQLVAAARRRFGSWTKAVVAAGVDPAKLRRVVPWSRERVIEAILMRALKNEPLGARSVQPRSLADAGARMFGSWGAALASAGLDPTRYVCRWPILERGTHQAPVSTGAAASEPVPDPKAAQANGEAKCLRVHQFGQRWSDQAVIDAILARRGQHRLLNAVSVYHDDRPLYRAATRRHGNWRNALIAAGLDPVEFRRYRGNCRTLPANLSAATDESQGA